MIRLFTRWFGVRVNVDGVSQPPADPVKADDAPPSRKQVNNILVYPIKLTSLSLSLSLTLTLFLSVFPSFVCLSTYLKFFYLPPSFFFSPFTCQLPHRISYLKLNNFQSILGFPPLNLINQFFPRLLFLCSLFSSV